MCQCDNFYHSCYLYLYLNYLRSVEEEGEAVDQIPYLHDDLTRELLTYLIEQGEQEKVKKERD